MNRPDARGYTPLIAACAGGHVDAARLLLRDRRVDRTRRAKKLKDWKALSLGGGARDGGTALHAAAAAGHAPVVRLLLKASDAAADAAAEAKAAAAAASQTRGHHHHHKHPPLPLPIVAAPPQHPEDAADDEGGGVAHDTHAVVVGEGGESLADLAAGVIDVNYPSRGGGESALYKARPSLELTTRLTMYQEVPSEPLLESPSHELRASRRAPPATSPRPRGCCARAASTRTSARPRAAATRRCTSPRGAATRSSCASCSTTPRYKREREREGGHRTTEPSRGGDRR